MSLPPTVVESLRSDAGAILRRIVADASVAEVLADEVVQLVSSDDAMAAHPIAWMAATASAAGLGVVESGTATCAEPAWARLLKGATVAQRTVIALVDACGYTVDEASARTQREPDDVRALWSAVHGTTLPAEPEANATPEPEANATPEPEANATPEPEPEAAVPAPPPMTPPPPTQAITPAPAAATRVDRRRWTIIGLGYLVVAALAFSAGLAWHRAPAAGPRAVESQLTEAASAFRGPSPGCDLPQGAVQSAPVPISVTSGGQTRGGRLIAGPPASPDTPRILVVDLPDRGEQIDDHAAATNLDAIAATQHLVVATLTAQDGPGEWNSDHVADRSDDLRFVDDVIDQEASTACIDLDRVVIAGRGTGAQMATAYACTRPARVGALVVVAQPSLPAGCAVSPPVTTLMIQPPSADVVHSWIDAYLCTPGEAQTTAPLTVTVYGGCRNSMSLTVAEVADAGATWPPEGAPVVERFLANLGG